MIRPRELALALLAALLAGCPGGAERHPAHGVVRDVNLEYGQILVEHDEIVGLMPAMTMSFDLADPTVAKTLRRGQVIDFAVEFTGDAYLVHDVRVTGEEGAAGGAEAGFEALAARRSPAPAFDLVDQDGRRVTLESLRGLHLLVDFVFTRCSGPCPILTSRHVALQRELSAAQRERVWFVSITLDPEHDTPAALREYALARGADLSRWSFLTGPPEVVKEVVQRFGVGSLRTPTGDIDHLVAAFVVDPEGRIAERFVGLQVASAELLHQLAPER